MPMSRLSYKFMLLFLAFTISLLLPLSFVVFYDAEHMVQGMENVAPLSHDQKIAQARGLEKLVDDIISISFYMAVLAFLMSLFFSRKIFVPFRGLYNQAKLISEGDIDTDVDVPRGDDFGELSRAFNDMAATIRKKSRELRRKDMYISAMIDPMWVLDEDNAVVEVNDAFMKVFGYSRDDMKGALVFDLVDDTGERQLRRRHYEDEGADGNLPELPFELSIISKNEGLIPVLLSETPIIENGKVTGRIGMIKDFRREGSLREALVAERDYSLAVMDSLVDQLVVMDRDLTVVKANLPARIFAGRDITGEKCHKVFHGLDEKCFMHHDDCPAELVFRTGETHRCIHEHTEGTGRKVFVEMVVYPLKDQQSGEIRHTVSLMRDVTDRKKFEDEIAVKNKELTALNTISRTLSRSLRAEGVFNEVLDRVVELLGMDGGGIYFIDENGRELKCQYHRGLSGEFMKTVAWIRMGEDIPGMVALTGLPVYAPDISLDRRAEKSGLKHSGVKGYACIPIRGKEKVLGILFIFSMAQHTFNQEEERILNSISEMMGISFENMRLYEKMRDLYEQQRQRRSEEQKNLLNLSHMLSSSIDMKSALSGCLSLIKTAMRADFVWMLDKAPNGALTVRTGSDIGFSEGDQVYAPGAESLEHHAITKLKPVTLNDIVTEDRIQMVGHLRGFRFACAIPMFIGEKIYGAFALYFNTMKRLSEEDIHFLQTVSSVLAVSLERASLYERVIIQKGTADAVLESIADGVITVNVAGDVMAANSSALRIFDINEHSISGMRMQDIFRHTSENSELVLMIESSMEDALTGKSKMFEAKLVGDGDRRVPLEVHCSPVRDNKGKIAGAVYVIRDLSIETEIDKMKTDFLRSVSHEFRTPLTAIVGLTEMVLGGEVEGERATEYLRNVLNEGRRLTSMVTDVLDITRIESGREVLSTGPVDFRAMFMDIEGSYAPAVMGRHLKLSLTGGDDVAGFVGDAGKIKQIVRNLIDNSIAYSDPDARIDVSVVMDGGTLMLTVRDTGWGIPADELAHMGQKFFRGRQVASRVKGTGLGLSLCKSLVEIQGGELRIQSIEGEGTSVTARIPDRREA